MKDKKLIKLGEDLQRERQKRNIKLEDIADRTKINISFLKSIEDGEFNFLSDTYVRYFLKAYLQQLGRNTGNLLDRYDQIMGVSSPSITDEDLKKSKQNNSTNKKWSFSLKSIKTEFEHHRAIFLGLFVVIIIFALYLMLQNNNGKLSIENNQANAKITEQSSQLASFSSFRVDNKKLNLNLVANEKTWLQIAIDDSVAQEYIFDSDDSFEWQAEEKFLLRIGNGAGVRLYLNGNDLGPLGKRMQVVNLVLTKDGIQKNKY